MTKQDDYNKYMREYMLRRYHIHMQWSIKFLGGKCVECGSIKQLEIDHKNPENKLFTISQAWSKKKDVILRELDKCQVLCHQCHIRKHHTGKVSHGTLSSYRYCHCEICRSAKAAYTREYRKKNARRARR